MDAAKPPSPSHAAPFRPLGELRSTPAIYEHALAPTKMPLSCGGSRQRPVCIGYGAGLPACAVSLQVRIVLLVSLSIRFNTVDLSAISCQFRDPPKIGPIPLVGSNLQFGKHCIRVLLKFPLLAPMCFTLSLRHICHFVLPPLSQFSDSLTELFRAKYLE